MTASHARSQLRHSPTMQVFIMIAALAASGIVQWVRNRPQDQAYYNTPAA
jgi:hypothetical protein